MILYLFVHFLEAVRLGFKWLKSLEEWDSNELAEATSSYVMEEGVLKKRLKGITDNSTGLDNEVRV